MDLDAKRIKELAEKYMTGAASAEEKQLLHEWYDSLRSGEVELVIQDSPVSLEEFGKQTLDEIRQRIAERNDTVIPLPNDRELPASGSEKSPSRIPARRYVAAACILFLIGSVVYLARWRRTPKEMTLVQSPHKKVKNDVLPGRNRATLVLANGSSIDLDSAGTGELARQGTARVVKLANGQLSYAALGKASKEILYNTMTVPRGGQYQLHLPDGTAVWLNAASSIRYPTAFTGAERQVEITGEAYFEVAANPHQPFVVLINQSEKVMVLGTHFNINAYSDEAAVNTTLLEGSVKVVRDNEVKLLLPGQQASSAKVGGLTLVKNPNTEAAVAWKNGVFLFDHSDIKSVMRQLARWYDVEVEYRGKPTTDLFGGDIRRSLPLSKICRFLEASQVHFSIEGDKIVVMP